MDWAKDILDLFLHLDKHLNSLADSLGIWLYGLLFLIVFCETGLVVTPFLPGDSLLFGVGALAATDGFPLRLPWLIGLLIVAAIAGDAVNYFLGFHFGERFFRSEHSWLFNKKHLVKTQQFYAKYGGKTIILARFIPIIRTFAPFVAGMGKMEYRRFALYNLTGGVVWVTAFLLLGYFFGNSELVKNNFAYVIAGIIVLSVLPAVIEVLLTRFKQAKPEPVGAEAE